MAQLPKFDMLAPRRGSLPVDENTGAAAAANAKADMFLAFARSAGQLTEQLTGMAARAAKREGQEAGLAAATSVAMPGVGFAFKPGSAGGATVSVNAGTAKAYLMDRHGFSDMAASAIVGHLDWESGLRPTGAVGDAGTAFGLAQWRGDRFVNLKAFAARTGRDWRSMESQLDFVVHELGTSESTAGRALSSAGTLEDAVAAFMHFERPAGWTAANPRGGHGWAGRLAKAQALAGSTAAIAAPPPASVPGEVTVSLTGAAGPVPRMAAGTIRGDAFNDAAANVYGNRLETAMRAQMDAIALQNPDDPKALDTALEALRAGYMEELPPELRAPMTLAFEREKLGHTIAAARRLDDRVRSENLASFEEILSTRMNSAARLAAQAGEGDEATRTRTEAALGAELDAIWRAIDASPLTPLEKSRRRREAQSDVLSARILGGFDNLDDPATRAEYIRSFQEEWKKGEGLAAGIDADDYERINGELIRRAKADEVEAAKRAAALDKSIETQLGYLKKGFPVSPDIRRQIAAGVAQTGDAALAQRVGFLDGLAEWQRAHVGERPEVIDAQIAALRTRIAEEGANEAALVSLDVMEELSKQMRDGLATDPLGWADRAGVGTIEPLDFSDGATLAASLTERTADARAVAAHYGIEPKFFTPAEADGLKKVLRETPLALPSLASSLVAGLGEDAPAAFAEISKDAPLLAHVGGLVQATGEQRLAVEAAEALEMRRQPGYKSALPTDAKLRSAAASALAGALGPQPEVFNQVLETAAAVFERRAAMRGLALDDFATDGAPSRELFLQALDEALGARTVGGVKHGGLTDVNGFTTIAPPDLPAEDLQDMMLELNTDDLLFQESIGTANGLPIAAGQLAAGRLVRQRDGRYLIALGDVEGGDPRFVPDAAGGLFELDIRMLAKSQQNRPASGWARNQDRRGWGR